MDIANFDSNNTDNFAVCRCIRSWPMAFHPSNRSRNSATNHVIVAPYKLVTCHVHTALPSTVDENANEAREDFVQVYIVNCCIPFTFTSINLDLRHFVVLYPRGCVDVSHVPCQCALVVLCSKHHHHHPTQSLITTLLCLSLN